MSTKDFFYLAVFLKSYLFVKYNMHDLHHDSDGNMS